ncbi:protein kintoun [Enoplosus armatus]|uniref:protein kintoun n=1 Tax=Enoplosus armatus TaxID=215367 RepID=UPI003991F6D8
MEVGDKLEELHMTVDEIDRLTKAFKDEKFREMLRDYAQELADPENKKRYEEEIKLLEQERGNTVEFIHPEPFRALRTSVNGKQKCFINICSNDKIGKPGSKWGVSEEGRRGQCWSLPHSLHPGREDRDPKGNKIMVYDVIFHPDTLHIASKNKRFMDMVDSTAIQGIQSTFKVTLDKNNVREMSTKYKGTLQPCVIRKPIPGFKTKEPSEKPDPLAFLYQDDRSTSSQTRPTRSPATKNSSNVKPESIQVQPQKAEGPTKPNYTVKYRSFIDLQDFRCSRDSAQSPRPKEIVVTIDVPLLKAVADASLEVKEGGLLLETKKPAYRLELPLAYPVDEDQGEAKFNKQKGQLTVTLPVLPSNEAFDFAVGPPQMSVSDCERQEETSEVEEDKLEEEREGQKSEEERDIVEEDLRHKTLVENGEEEEERGQEKEEEQMGEGHKGIVGQERVVSEKEKGRKQEREGENSEEQEIGEEEAKWKKQIRKGQKSVEEKLKEQKQENKKEVGTLNPQERQQHEDTGISKDECDRAAEQKDSGETSFWCDTVDQCIEVSAEKKTSCVAPPETENQPVLITAEYSSYKGEEGEVTLNSCLESTPKMKTSDIKGETGETKESLDGNPKVETETAFLHHGSSEESQTTVSSTPAFTQSQNNTKDCCISQRTDESSKTPATDEATKLSRGGSGDRVTLFPEDLGAGSGQPEAREEDDLPEHNNKPPPALFREIDKDGNEKVISDHSTSAGFIFQNSLMYELD